MRATHFEFRHRFWCLGLIFTLGFFCYRWDPRNVVVAALTACGVDAPTAGPGLGILRACFAAGALVAAGGAALRTWAAAYLDSDVVHDPRLHTERVVADGPYRRVRNPLYLGLLLIAVGFSLLASRLGAAVILVGITLFSLRLIGREEDDLRAARGEAYERYRRSVPRLLPAVRPRLPRGGGVPHWAQALAGEAFAWGFAVALAVYAATLRMRPYLWALGGSMAVYFVVLASQRLLHRPGAPGLPPGG